MAIIKTISKASKREREFSSGSRDSESSDEDDHQHRSSNSESDENSDAIDDAVSAAGSDDIDLSELGEVGEEFCQVGNYSCSIPLELYDLPGLGEILSIDSWNNCLTEDERFSLTKYLPDMDELTCMLTLKELFLGRSFHFGSPLIKLFDMMKGGLCEPRVSLYQQGLNFIQKREHYHQLCNYHNSMVAKLIQIRDAWENCRGYTIAKKLHVLNMKRSQRYLISGNIDGSEPETNSSGGEDSDDDFWNKRLKDVQPKTKLGRQAVYARSPGADVRSHGRSVALEPAKYGQKNAKGILKVAGMNVPSANEAGSHFPSLQRGLGTNSRPYGSSSFLSHRDHGIIYDVETIPQTRGHSRCKDDGENPAYDMTVKGNWSSTLGSAMSKLGVLKQGKNTEFLKSKDRHASESFKGFSLENDNLHGSNINRNQIENMDALAENQNSDRAYCGYALHSNGKKGNLLDKHQGSAFGDQMNTVKDRGQLLALKKARSDELDVRSKKRKMGQELQTGADMVLNSKGKSHTSFLARKPNTHLQPSDDRRKISQAEIRNKLSHERGLDLDGQRGMGRFIQSEETESDSSEQVDEEEEEEEEEAEEEEEEEEEEEDIKPLRTMFGRPSGILAGRQSALVKSVSGPENTSNLDRKVKKEQGLDRFTHSSKKLSGFGDRLISEHETDSSKRKHNSSMRDLSYLPNLAIDDMEHFQKTVKNSYMQGDPGGRMRLPFSKAFAGERKQKGKNYDDYSVPGPNIMYNYDREDDNGLYATTSLIDDRLPINNSGKKGKFIASHVIDHQERPNMSLLGSKGGVSKKWKGQPDLTYRDELDEADYLHSSPHQQIADPSLKKRGKSSSPMVISESLISQRGLADSPDTKPVKKPFTLIMPTVHTGFSFSIIHLLSAVRMALITPVAADVSEKKNQGGASRDPSNISGPLDQNKLPSPTIQEIVSRVRSTPGDPSILETQEPLQDLVRGVLKIFISKTAPLGAKGWKALVSFEKATKGWTWIGPVSDTNTVEEVISSEAWILPHKMLVKLVDAFANWLKNGQETLQQIGSLPAPPMALMQPSLDEKERFRDLRAQKSLTTITASSEEVRAYFRKEEFLRYSVPDRAFSYTAADGKKSIVAPLRRCGGKPTSKARDHYMLKPDRPPHVTVLCLVRDAASRLPGSIGTRADVCTLIRDSQYIVEDVSDAQINQVVSGALDRLHYERDPCVQFDGERKLWVYLHREREEEDFEDDGTASTKKWKRQRKDPTEQSEPGINNIAYYEPEEQIVGGLVGGFGLNTDLNIEPSPIHEDEGLEFV